NSLQRAYRRNIQRRHAARLLHLHVGRTSVARNVKGDVYPLRRSDPRVDFVLEPVLRNLLLNHAHVPRILDAEIAARSRDAKAALGAGRAESSIRTADRPALAKGNLIRLLFRRGLRLLLR